MIDQQAQPVFVVKSYQLIIGVLVLIIGWAASYGALVAKTDQNHADMEYIRNHSIDEAVFREMKQSMENRLERIENKIDQQRDVQQLSDMQRDNAHRRVHQ